MGSTETPTQDCIEFLQEQEAARRCESFEEYHMGIFLIGSAAEQAGVCPNTVRGYDRQGLISPVRDSAGRRLFSLVDIERIRQIHAAKQARKQQLPTEP